MKVSVAPARAFALVALATFTLAVSSLCWRSSSTAIAQSISPTGELRELAIDDGTAERALGQDPTQPLRPGFGWANRLTPTSYPATLRSITIGFNRAGPLVAQDLNYRIVVFIDPEMDGPSNDQQPDATFIGRVRGFDQIMTFNLISPLRITGGSFVIGVIDINGIGGFPALFDIPGRSTPPGSESFFTLNGGVNWRTMRGEPAIPEPGSFLIRATVETDPVDVLSVTRIKDPAAVEPWSVWVNNSNSEVFVTNYVSDNITIIKTADNTFQNVALTDPRLCPQCGPPLGPFGVVGKPDGTMIYITLFGSSTVPSREFPTDYSAVGPGRLLILTRQSDGTFRQGLLLAIGKGPRFPAILPDGSKLYVPCGGANTVDVINTTTNQRIRSIPVGIDPSSCTLSLDASKLYVTNFGGGTISVIDTKTDQVVKTIANLPAAPWLADVSPVNGNLYVTVRDQNVSPPPEGSVTSDRIILIDTCKDEVIRQIIDDTTRGTPAGSAGASGIPAPTAPLTRDPATGLTPGAGGGGGGPFGIAGCPASPAMIFTNDGLGVIGAFDTRIDQVVSAPPVAIASCPKPRGVDCGRDPRPAPAVIGLPVKSIAYVACGQPDSSVLIVNIPGLSENLPAVPVIDSIDFGNKLRIRGRGFTFVSRIEVTLSGSTACLTFDREPKSMRGGTLIVQKGRLTDGRKLTEAVPAGTTVVIRVINLDGSTRVISFTRS